MTPAMIPIKTPLLFLLLTVLAGGGGGPAATACIAAVWSLHFWLDDAIGAEATALVTYAGRCMLKHLPTGRHELTLPFLPGAADAWGCRPDRSD